MKKTITLFSCFVLMAVTAHGQLLDGTLAPNFTGTDTDGNQWTLYDILDQGKSVVLDISATWCSPCWDYHETHILQDLYEQYGPDGTDEVMVLFIEGDENTNGACIVGDTDNCDNVTLGDWTSGTDYPIIDDHNIAQMYQVGYYPTFYHICPNRIVTEVEAISVADHIANHNQCATAVGANNLGVVDYTGFEGSFCTSMTFAPNFVLQNLGADEVTSAEIQLTVDGTLDQTLNWTGSLNTYQTETVTFNEITINSNLDFEIAVVSVNGLTDDQPDDNTISLNAGLAQETTDNLINLALNLGDVAFSPHVRVYWELVDENGNILYTGGNPEAVGGVYQNTGFYETDAITDIPLALPADGCYEFRFYDMLSNFFQFGEISYTITDQNGNILLESNPQPEERNMHVQLLHLNGGSDVINNATILSHTNEPETFCNSYTYQPTLTIQNIGNNEINSMTIDVNDKNGLVDQFDWTGNISTYGFGFIELDAINLSETTNIDYEISSVNGVMDAHDHFNKRTVDFYNISTESPTVTFQMLMSSFVPEYNILHFINPAGDTLFQQGGYTPGQLVTETFMLEEGVDDCYEILITNITGLGLLDYATTTYVKILDENGNEIFYKEMNELTFTERSFTFEGNLESTAVIDLQTVSKLTVFPNPAQQQLNISFTADESMPLEISIFNAFGQEVKTIAERDFEAGQQQISTDVSNLPNGMYYVQLLNTKGQKTQKFVVLN